MNVKKSFTIDKILKISLLCLSCMIIVAIGKSSVIPDQQLTKKQAQLAIRAIGDELLTYAHDTNSPVQPVQEIDERTLRLGFKDPIPINPDSLSLLALKYINEEVTPRVIVNVFEVPSKKMVYGFEINYARPKEIPCLGRILPESNYYVDFSFYETQPMHLALNAFIFGILGFMLVSFVLFRFYFSKESKRQFIDPNTIKIKDIKLNLDSNQLIFNEKTIKLTNKETQIFSILLQNEGNLVSREYLTEEVWLKEGVVTSRSLDMYISRLRKKVKVLSNTEILNQHGKGYILKVG